VIVEHFVYETSKLLNLSEGVLRWYGFQLRKLRNIF